jgi:AAA domain-containing protein/primase-like protein/bifunctional DNA primase/polymerase-like protein
MTRFADAAPILAEAGYRPIPIKENDKAPAISAWTKYTYAPQDRFRFKKEGVGLLCGELRGIDIDVRNEDVSLRIEALAKNMLSIGTTAPRRIGQWPKTLLMVRSTAGPKMATAPYRLESDTFDNDPHKVEILGEGQQFVAYGIHPKTGREYEWNGAVNPMTVKFADLPFVPEQKLRAFLSAAEQILTDFGTRCGKLGREDNGTLHKPADQLTGDYDTVASAVRSIPNNNLSRDDWITMGHAIKGALGEAGRDLWLQWSRSSGKSGKSGVANTPERAWDTFKPKGIGSGTIYFEAKRYGWTRPAKPVPDIPSHVDEAPLIGDDSKQPASTIPKRRLELRPASQIAATPSRAEWLLRPYLERNVLALMYGELGTLKSFVALEFGLCVASGEPSRAFTDAIVHGGNVIYISAEGKGLWRRLKGWSIARGINLEDVHLWAIERPVDTFGTESLLELAEAINVLGVKPDLVIIDTLSRNSGAADENKSADMSAYLNGLDKMLRIPFECTVLLVHHVGHAAKDRARGSYILMANTDANYQLERPDPNRLLIELKTGRLKDSESPQPINLVGRVVELGTQDEDGKPETTLVLDATQEVAPSKKREPTGKNQTRALDVISGALNSGKTLITVEAIRLVKSACNMPYARAKESVEGLLKAGYLRAPMGAIEVVSK